MSGGSHNYMYYKVEDEFVGKMHDTELNEMMKDLVKVLHDLEWCDSADIEEEDYAKTVTEFKKKWLKRDKQEIEKFINEQFEKKKEELLKDLEYLK